MNETENDLQSGARITELEERCGELRRIVNILFAGLVVTSFTLTAYLALEGHRASQDADVAKQRAEYYQRVVQQDDAAIQAFYTKMQEFGRTHPDFQKQILSKYKVTNNAQPAKP